MSTRMPRDEAPARRAERVIACFECVHRDPRYRVFPTAAQPCRPVRAAAADNLFHPKSPPFRFEILLVPWRTFVLHASTSTARSGNLAP